LRTSLGYLNAEGGEAKTIMISSSLPGEGKSFIATNIALSMALSGKKTLLIESDMRKPGVAKYFKVSSRLGLSMHLVGKLNLEEILFATEFENLTIIPAGPIPPNPVELILNGKYEQMLKELGKMYDQIIIDCPPIGLVTDARVIGKWVDATVLIVRQQHTPRESVGMILESLNQQKVLRNVGLVFNGLKGGISGYGYGYSYANYGYGGYGYGYGYGGYSYGYGYYGNTKKKSTPLKFIYNVLVVPFFAFFAKNWMKRKN
jgi:capsular exopolysaccharide synthesis family protein